MRPEATQEPLDLRLVPAAVTAWLVAWQARAVPPGPVVLLAVVAAAAGLVLLLRSPRRAAAGLAAALLCAAAAGTCTAARVHSRTTGPLPALAERGAAVVVEAVVTDDPRTAGAAAGGRPLVVAQVRVERVTSAGRVQRLRAPVLVLTQERAWLGLLPGQRLSAEGRLRAAEPGDDVAAVLSARGRPVLLGRPGRLQRVAGRLRGGLRDAVAVLPEAERGLLPGLVVGDTSRLDPQLREDFRSTGLTHLVAVSGTNCAIVAGAVLLLSRRLGLGLRASPVLAGLALLGFVVLARPSPSVLRAAVMGGVGLVGLATGSRRSALPALAASVLLLVLLDPDLAGTAGFALSVLATGGLLLLAPGWRDALARRLPRWLAEALAVPAAAQVACGPVVVALAGTLGLLSVPANLLAVPAVAPATVLGVLCALVAPVSLPLAQGVAWLAWVPTAWLVLVARRGAVLPGGQLPWPDGRAGALLLVLVTLALVLVLRRALLRQVLAVGTVGVLLAVAGLGALRPGWPPHGWFMVSCSVGQGDASVLSLGRGQALVVDAGPDPRAVDRCLRRLHVRSVPLVVLTHLHADHVDGLPGVLHGRAVGQVEVGPLDEPEAQWREVQQQAAAAGVPVAPAAVGSVRSAGGVRWEVVAPAHAFHGTSSDPNNSSLVLRVEVGGVRLLLTGDVEPEAQRELVRSGADLTADVLKVPHHGSRHQDPAFLAAVRPRLALTSVGQDNGYGHPSAQTLGQLLDEGARSYRTDRDGDTALALRDGQLVSAGHDGDGTLRGPQAQPRAASRPARGPGGTTARLAGPAGTGSAPSVVAEGWPGAASPVDRAGSPSRGPPRPSQPGGLGQRLVVQAA
ncbi:MAG: competence protein ComEC, partial [Frankiales bacterium]|nr:competence protein ComEC [Frankiales bacterium]